MRFIGLDLPKKLLAVYALDRRSKVLFRASVECRREAPEAFVRTTLRKTDLLAVEATTNTWAVSAAWMSAPAAWVGWPSRRRPTPGRWPTSCGRSWPRSRSATRSRSWPSPGPRRRPTRSTPGCSPTCSGACTCRPSGPRTRPPRRCGS